MSGSTTLVRSSKPHSTVHLLPTFVYDHLLKASLGGSSLNDPLVNGVGSDKSIHHHWLSLTNAVTAILSLKVTRGILMGGVRGGGRVDGGRRRRIKGEREREKREREREG